MTLLKKNNELNFLPLTMPANENFFFLYQDYRTDQLIIMNGTKIKKNKFKIGTNFSKVTLSQYAKR